MTNITAGVKFFDDWESFFPVKSCTIRTKNKIAGKLKIKGIKLVLKIHKIMKNITAVFKFFDAWESFFPLKSCTNRTKNKIAGKVKIKGIKLVLKILKITATIVSTINTFSNGLLYTFMPHLTSYFIIHASISQKNNSFRIFYTKRVINLTHFSVSSNLYSPTATSSYRLVIDVE